MATDPVSSPRALWPLPLLAGLLPLLATVLAWRLSLAAGTVPDCNPFVDGCASISRAGRHGLANIVFRGMLLPAAVLQGITWMACGAWLAGLGAPLDRPLRALPVLGVAAAAFLVLYGTFLGTEGEGYRWMRRYGITFYFGFTCIGMLIVGERMARAPARQRIGPRVAAALVTVCALLPLLGLVHVLLPLAWPAPALKDVLENVTEWWAGAIFTAFFVGLALAWRRTGFGLRLGSSGH